jgi:hypothetical protein
MSELEILLHPLSLVFRVGLGNSCTFVDRLDFWPSLRLVGKLASFDVCLFFLVAIGAAGSMAFPTFFGLDRPGGFAKLSWFLKGFFKIGFFSTVGFTTWRGLTLLKCSDKFRTTSVRIWHAVSTERLPGCRMSEGLFATMIDCEFLTCCNYMVK